METVQLNIPLGYQINERKLQLSVGQVRDLLLSRRRNKYTYAHWYDDFVELKSDFIECPHCGHRVYAYAKHLNKAFGTKLPVIRGLAKSIIRDWATIQMSFFEKDIKELRLNNAIKYLGDLVCPKCKNTMQCSSQSRTVQVIRENHKISIRMEIIDIKELFSLPCVFDKEITIKFPLFEVACFNFKNGHSYVRLENSCGECLAVRDFTFDKYTWTDGVVYSTIAKNKHVCRIIKNAFAQEWGGKIPFFPSEIGVNELRLLTMFIGYNRAFYSCIPFSVGTYEIDESFRTCSKKMRYANNAIEIYKNSKLPNMKSVRKTFFQNPGLFFYVPESERLWQILKNPDYFVELFGKQTVFRILSDLHIRPKIFEFLEDYVEIGKMSVLFNLMSSHWDYIREYAVNYGSMSNYMKKSEHSKWLNQEFERRIEKFPDFAIPMCDTGERIRNCTIDEYEFSWLKTSADYEEAGKALNNCLVHWKSNFHPVVCVRKSGKIIAALEIRRNFVYQAYTTNNRHLTQEPGLFEAYAKWHDKNHLTFEYSRDYEDDDELLDDVLDLPMPF